MREQVAQRVGDPGERGGEMDRDEPAAVAEIQQYAGRREHHHDHVDQPVQDDIERVVTELAGARDEKGADLPERDARRQAGEEVPSPNLTLRKDRFEQLGDERVGIVGGDPYAGENADEKRNCRDPVEDDGPYVAAWRAGARSALRGAGTTLTGLGLAAARARERLIIPGDVVHHRSISPSPLSIVLRGQRASP